MSRKILVFLKKGRPQEAIIHGCLIVYEKLSVVVAVHRLSTTHTKQQRSKTENIIVNTILLSVSTKTCLIQ